MLITCVYILYCPRDHKNLYGLLNCQFEFRAKCLFFVTLNHLENDSKLLPCWTHRPTMFKAPHPHPRRWVKRQPALRKANFSGKIEHFAFENWLFDGLTSLSSVGESVPSDPELKQLLFSQDHYRQRNLDSHLHPHFAAWLSSGRRFQVPIGRAEAGSPEQWR